MISPRDFFRVGFIVVSTIFILSLTGCNSGSKDTMPAENDNSSATTSNSEAVVAVPQVDSATTVKTEAPTEARPSVAAQVVTIENMKFNPATITIKKGDQVTFINKDIVGHNATEIHNAWASPMLATGQSWTFTPEKTSDYYCTVHVVMKGKIIVK